MKLAKNPTLLALLSAFLLWLAWPPIPYATPLLLIALVPLLLALSQIKESDRIKKGKKIFLTAGLCFLIWNTASIYWVYNAISAVNDPITGFFVSLIPYGLGALMMTFAFWLYYRLGRVAGKYISYLGLICFYVAMEYLHETWDLSFPWMTLGNGLAGMHQLAQWYEYTGVHGGSVWILLSNILAFEAYRYVRQNNPVKLRLALVWLAFVLIPVAVSLKMYYGYTEKSMPVNVVTVQPNIDPYKKYASLSAADQLRILTRLSDSVGQPNTEYFIWPETAIPVQTDEDQIRSSNEYLLAQQFLSKYKNGTLITGIESIKQYQDKQTITAKATGYGGFYDSFNAAMQVENSANVQFYHKSKLVPGVEKMPYPSVFAVLTPLFEGFGGTVGGWGWQDHPAVFYSYGGVGVAPVVCYESLWGGWISESVRNGAQFIAIITNDAWWGNTSGKEQHLLYAKLRAIETRRSIVRSANTGISAFINQRGDIVQQSKWWTATALRADINLNDTLTFYVLKGNYLPLSLCLIGTILALLVAFKRFFSKA